MIVRMKEWVVPGMRWRSEDDRVFEGLLGVYGLTCITGM